MIYNDALTGMNNRQRALFYLEERLERDSAIVCMADAVLYARKKQIREKQENDNPTQREFAERIRQISSKYPYIKAVQDGKIAGYAYAGTFKWRQASDK